MPHPDGYRQGVPTGLFVAQNSNSTFSESGCKPVSISWSQLQITNKSWQHPNPELDYKSISETKQLPICCRDNLQILSRHAYIYACQCRVTDVTLLKFPLQTKIQSGSTICIRKVLQCEIASNPKLMRKDQFFFALKRENLQEALLLGRRKLVQYMR